MMMFCALDVPAAVCTGIVYRTPIAWSEVAFGCAIPGNGPSWRQAPAAVSTQFNHIDRTPFFVTKSRFEIVRFVFDLRQSGDQLHGKTPAWSSVKRKIVVWPRLARSLSALLPLGVAGVGIDVIQAASQIRQQRASARLSH
jgi:hypothetical protein